MPSLIETVRNLFTGSPRETADGLERKAAELQHELAAGAEQLRVEEDSTSMSNASRLLEGKDIQVSASLQKARERQAALGAALIAVRAQAERVRAEARAGEVATIRDRLAILHVARHRQRALAAALKAMAAEADATQGPEHAEFGQLLGMLHGLGANDEAIALCSSHPGDSLDLQPTLAFLRLILEDAPTAAPAANLLPSVDHLLETREQRAGRERQEAVEREDAQNKRQRAERRKLAQPLVREFDEALADVKGGDLGGWNRTHALGGRIRDLDPELADQLAKRLGVSPDAARLQEAAPIGGMQSLASLGGR